jgi:predicted site-specific integrase-resolvase
VNYVKLRQAVELTGLHPNTLRKYADEGKIETLRTPYGQRLFNCESFLSIPSASKIILYCRVSSPKQRKDLDSQIASLVSLYPQAEVSCTDNFITDLFGDGKTFTRQHRFIDSGISRYDFTIDRDFFTRTHYHNICDGY